MEYKKIILALFVGWSLALAGALASTEQVVIEIDEFVDQTVEFNPLPGTGEGGLHFDSNENQTEYNLTGYIRVLNTGGNDLADLFIELNNTEQLSLPVLFEGRNGTFRENDTSSGTILLHIPQLRAGENSTWIYSINETNIRPPLNFTSEYDATKVLAGDPIVITDRIQNVFDNATYQTNTCIFDIFATQTTIPVNFGGSPQDFTYNTSSTTGTDAANVVYPTSLVQEWNVSAGGCLNLNALTDITYQVFTPLNIPETTNYQMINTTLAYTLNSSISRVTVSDIKAVGDAALAFDKEIISPSDPLLHGSNVTWEVYGNLTTDSNINYLLEEVTFWVAIGPLGDPNTLDNDTISGNPLTITENPNFLFNSTTPWISNQWLFNYTDIPTPIVWMDVNFTIDNDGTQLINRSVTRNGNDIYIKELYLIIGYWLEIEKNLTSVGEDVYDVRIDVHNRGNQVTPEGTVVTIYDFVPGNYNITTPFSFSSSPWYTTSTANNTVSGNFSGTLYRWALNPSGSAPFSTSFAPGPARNENTTWSVEFTVEGQGEYELLDVFVTGLDPMQVDGAGSTPGTVVTQVIEKVKSTEGIFATVASVLLLLGLLL